MNNAAATQNQAPVTRDTNSVERSYLSPEVNIFETKDGFSLEAEMPGVNKEGLEITLEGNALTLVGQRNNSLPGVELICRESKPADFRRVFELDRAIDTARISATMEQGILTLLLPKSERVKPRNIPVAD